MDAFITIAKKIAEYSVPSVGRQLGYLFSYTTNIQNLENQLQHLNNAKDTINRGVHQARNNCEEILSEVESCLTRVNEVSSEVNNFLTHEDHDKVVCSCGSFPHLVTRHQLSRQAEEMSNSVSDVLKTWEKLNNRPISYRPQIESSFTTRGYETFDSRERIRKEIMVAVRDANRSRIGLCGMAGIGKTMLAKKIARQAQKENLFMVVVLTPISQTPNIKEIQQCIADRLDLKFSETDRTVGKRGDLLQKRLKQDESKILLILDDVWQKLDLEEIGIHDKCKLLLTSRDGDVLSNHMEIIASNIFKIEVLRPEEAMILFKKIVGDIVNNQQYMDLALKIVTKCGGLPICIATVAHALKCSKELSQWEDAEKSIAGIREMDNIVYSSIKISYDFLRDDKEAKSLLLLCALHKEDANIGVEDLMRYSVGWRLIRLNTMKEARNRVDTLVINLKSRCLLLDGENKSFVKMHDVIRDVCISIAKERNNMHNITSDNMYDDFVTDDANKGCKAVSFLSYDNYDKLPPKLECPSLELLLMSSRSIGDDFFKQTTKLKALQMQGRFRILPSSFQSLEKLQTLCLSRTSIEDIAVIGELKSLKVLEISFSHSIKLLPEQIGQLKCLQLLDLRGCYNLKVIEPNVISNLKVMEELYLPSEFQARNVTLKEIKSLQHLTVLFLSVQSANILPNGMFHRNMERYRVSIGGRYSRSDLANEFSRWLHLTLSNMKEINRFGLGSMIKRSEYLLLEGLNVTNIVRDLDENGFPTLRHLKLKQLPCLERIGHGNLPTDSFKELRKLELWNCRRLKNLFPLSVAKFLHEIIVAECESMEDIISGHGRENEGDDEAVDNIVESLELRRLELQSLPKLVRFYCAKQTTGESSSVDHSKLLFNKTISYPNLEELSLKKLYNTEKLWPEQFLSDFSVQNLTQLKVEYCTRLKYLFTSNFAKCFVSLRTMKVMHCEAMENICVTTKKFGEESESEMISFPKLESIELGCLPSIQRFCATDSNMEFSLPSTSTTSVDQMNVNQFLSAEPFFNGKVSFPKLKNLTLYICNDVKYLFSFSLAQNCASLKNITLGECKAMEDIVVKVGEEEIKLEMILFPELESFQLIELRGLQRFCPTDYVMEFPLLSELAENRFMSKISINTMFVQRKDCILELKKIDC